MSINVNTDLLDIVPTKASLINKNKIKEFKLTVFEEHNSKLRTENDVKKIKTNLSRSSLDEVISESQTKIFKNDKTKNTEFNIKKAKHEVINFAISGSNHKDKRAAEIALAIKLGAKPPKNEYKNYKELRNEKKTLKEKETNAGKLSLLGKNQYGAPTTRCNKKRSRKIVSQISKHYGVINPNLKKKK